MNAASAYGRGRWLQSQLIYSSFSLQIHNQAPAAIDFDALQQADDKRFSPFTLSTATISIASFTHLAGYASNYYTYVLDKVIAIDFFSQFDKHNLLGWADSHALPARRARAGRKQTRRGTGKGLPRPSAADGRAQSLDERGIPASSAATN